VQQLQNQLAEVKNKLARLTDAYLVGTLELVEFQETKNVLEEQKATLEEKLDNFSRTSDQWLKLTKNWVLTANTAAKLAKSNDFSEMKYFLKKIGSNPSLSSGQLQLHLENPWIYLQELHAQSRTNGTALNKKFESSVWWTSSEQVENLSGFSKRSIY
jgi:hypothetical protein